MQTEKCILPLDVKNKNTENPLFKQISGASAMLVQTYTRRVCYISIHLQKFEGLHIR